LYRGYGFAVENPNSADPLWCTAGDDDAGSCRKAGKTRKKRSLDLSDPWSLLIITGLLVFAWAMHSRAQRAWLLKEFRVQSIDEAVGVFRDMQTQHHLVSEDLEDHFEINERLMSRERAWKEQMELLQNATKREAHRAVIDKYELNPFRLVRFV
jgi:hypothetical protein